VDGAKGHKSNASMMTLDSVRMATPPAVDVSHAEKELGATSSATDVEETERPTVERFYTAGAGAGAGLFSSGVQPEEVEGKEKAARPPVERFETAQEDLNMLAKAGEKA
jgi:hypothetical protein